ncbi:1218_t:CDS:2 [Entrophospora sp. SA101]|nr:1218_t:CDS:2 [Entrophospora sp. SA101]
MKNWILAQRGTENGLDANRRNGSKKNLDKKLEEKKILYYNYYIF